MITHDEHVAMKAQRTIRITDGLIVNWHIIVTLNGYIDCEVRNKCSKAKILGYLLRYSFSF
jgi:ABC-type lipoprotein export system ATPase subunit